ncbi:family 1 encapsulin nanocompartment shell protein [Mesorhizobium sp. SP-1A]|uniref:family 1 encapsulin nanocompartment shell protein n=1 Tax=Mesorhizobium sp. SP-1A TaxID=3077840 RepID=UPI0028F74DB1|nr:family 1 encapsulin nanocompartment shell protein [Mesorhizobium sp. SP-1A]
MNNLHRELAPISDAAWAEIEEEASRTLKRYLAARRVVDVVGPKGVDYSAANTGHVREITAPAEGIQSLQRDVKALVELRVPFQLSRQQIDDVERGATDSDWSPVKEAARKIAFAEDRAVFDGYAAAAIQGIREGSSNAGVALPADVSAYPMAVAQAVSQLRLAGVNGPYALVLGADAYTAASGGNEGGYPILHHLDRLVDGGIVWAPAIEGGFVMTTRGGDFELDVGQDISIGYLSHSSTTVELYFQESFTFRLLTTEAAVVLSSAEATAPGAK